MVLGGLAAGLGGETVHGQNPAEARGYLPVVSPAEAGYMVRHWTVEDGLPWPGVTSITQTPDGYLWCGTSGGLVRYDGLAFEPFTGERVPVLKDFAIRRLACDRDGRLWIWGGKNELVLMEDGRFRKIGPEDGWDGEWVFPVVGGTSGDYWFEGRPDGDFYRFGGERFEKVVHPLVRARPVAGRGGVSVGYAWADEGGLRWGMFDGPRRTVVDGAWLLERRLVKITPEGYEDVAIAGRGARFHLQVFCTLTDGTAALGSRDGIYAVEDGKWGMRHRFDRPVLKSEGAMLFVEHDARGNFWIATNYGGLILSEEDGTTRRFALPDEARRPSIEALHRDLAGDLWVGSSDGLYQVRRKTLRPLGHLGKPFREGVRSMAQSEDGALWLAAEET